MSIKMTAAELRAALPQFTGTEQWTRYSPLYRQLLITDGVKFLAENAGCYWLIDAIGSHVFTNRRVFSPQAQPFQTWRFKRAPADQLHKKHKLWAEDGNGNELVRQMIEYSDFPLDEIELFLAWDGGFDAFVLMLPSEY